MTVFPAPPLAQVSLGNLMRPSAAWAAPTHTPTLVSTPTSGFRAPHEMAVSESGLGKRHSLRSAYLRAFTGRVGSVQAGSAFLSSPLAHRPLTPALRPLGTDVKPTLSAGRSQTCISAADPVWTLFWTPSAWVPQLLGRVPLGIRPALRAPPVHAGSAKRQSQQVLKATEKSKTSEANF